MGEDAQGKPGEIDEPNAVTQQFNATTSMGTAELNVLLSFAQSISRPCFRRCVAFSLRAAEP